MGRQSEDSSQTSSNLELSSKRRASRRRRGGLMLRVAETTGSTIPQASLQKFPQRLGATAPERILVVEEDRTVQKALIRVFEAEGYDVQMAPHGATAVELFRAGQPAAVVLHLR